MPLSLTTVAGSVGIGITYLTLAGERGARELAGTVCLIRNGRICICCYLIATTIDSFRNVSSSRLGGIGDASNRLTMRHISWNASPLCRHHHIGRSREGDRAYGRSRDDDGERIAALAHILSRR